MKVQPNGSVQASLPLHLRVHAAVCVALLNSVITVSAFRIREIPQYLLCLSPRRISNGSLTRVCQPRCARLTVRLRLQVAALARCRGL